ncbi:hypothetical protein [Spirosoma radiotolerans]|uniref:DUF2780 domain-containing protein n=1 Tax=Spirosoma radiotolerans TaxID=1379870 RepID=A0A0E3VAJ2_9BACT|nr:hypothetical protein [Spirosoma radiotolerans]AKD58171.1 hypothetical protein SD10_28000 [Spirosoma radiotolerans]
MKTIRLKSGVIVLLASLFVATTVSAQLATPVAQMALGLGTVKWTTVLQDSSSTVHLDNAVAALNKGDKATTTQELQAGISGLEAEAQAKPTSFKDKLLAQANKLKALLPLIPTGALGNGVLGKAVSLAKLASGGNKLEGILAAGSLLGKGSQLTSSLSGIGSALSGLGGGSSAGQSLVSTALATVGKLNQGGLAAKAAEPVAKSQINSILNFVKGAL